MLEFEFVGKCDPRAAEQHACVECELKRGSRVIVHECSAAVQDMFKVQDSVAKRGFEPVRLRISEAILKVEGCELEACLQLEHRVDVIQLLQMREFA